MKPLIPVDWPTRRYRGQLALDNASFGTRKWVAP
jgi:hypothetical protein